MVRRGDEIMKITARYCGRDRHGNFFLRDLEGDFVRDHAYLNGRYNEIPSHIKPGQRIEFYASTHYSNHVMKLTDIRQIEVIS
jgi:hypothetical protein